MWYRGEGDWDLRNGAVETSGLDFCDHGRWAENVLIALSTKLDLSVNKLHTVLHFLPEWSVAGIPTNIFVTFNPLYLAALKSETVIFDPLHKWRYGSFL